MRRAALLLAAAIFLLDQLSKWLVIHQLRLAEVGQIVVLPVFNLSWVENRGISLGLLTADSDAQRWALVALTGAIAAGVLVWLWRERSRGDALALGAVLGGALGNIVDRSRYGYVVDFMDLHFGDWRPFLVFNLADAAITLGVVTLLLRGLLAGRAKKEVVDA